MAGGGGGWAVSRARHMREARACGALSQSRKSTVTSKDMALASSMVSRRVFESWKAKTMSWSPWASK